MTEPLDFQPTGNVELDNTLAGLNAEVNAINDFILPKEMAVSAAQEACDFFGLPEVPVIDAQGTCVWPNDVNTYDDDVFGFNREELMSIGISGKDSLTLIYTHECAHRTLQGAFNDSWEEELACDFFAGVHAGLKDIDIDNFEASLGSTNGSASHPNGALRAEFMEFGQQIAKDMQSRGIEITYENCLEQLNAHLEDKGGLIAEYRERFDPNYNNGLVSEDTMSGEAKGFIDDKAWHEKEAQNNFDNAAWHEKEAARASERGDHSAAKDHLSRAQSYNSAGKDHMRSASQCTK